MADDIDVYRLLYLELLRLKHIELIADWLQRLADGISLKEFAIRYPLGSTHQTLRTGTVVCLAMTTMIVNLPQIWLNVGYMLWNNQITRIWMSHEWWGYYHTPKLPRLSHNAHQFTGVRATRFLQLPYAGTASLMAIHTLLNFLRSEALFVDGGDGRDYGV